jgi:hypothetical protein
LKKAEKKQVQSYVWDCALAVLDNVHKAKNKIDFKELMKKQGFKTSWEDNKKHITFTDIKREQNGEQKKSVRLSKLFDYFNIQEFETKENLLNEFKRNSERTKQPGTNPNTTKSNTDIFAEYQQHRADERAKELERIRVQNARRIAEKQRRELEKNRRGLQRTDKNDFSIGR